MAWKQKNRRPKAVELAQRRKNVAELYLQGLRMVDIGERLGITKGTVSKDLKRAESEWMDDRNEAIDKLKARELAKIAHEERELFEAWSMSKASRAFGVGDLRVFQHLDKLRDRRCQILGLYAPSKTALTDPTGEHAGNWALLLPQPYGDDSQWEKALEELPKPAGPDDGGTVH